MLRSIGTALAAVGLLLGACTTPYAGEYAKGSNKTLGVTKDVWSGYEEYVGKLTGVNKGVFVVAAIKDVGLSYVYYYCPGTKCIYENTAKKAMEDCKGMDPRVDCVMFAQSATILVNYKQLDQ
ncbi:MAG TPA: hypothetical protein VMT54_16835 [Candidatus Cybelea sp.]|nr:hypothetical protein [Candidatus Cybelea sp.]